MKSHWTLTVLIALILALLGGVYLAGYRVGPGLSLVKTRELTINDLYPGTTIYADLTPRGTVASSSSSFSLTLTPGQHSILVNAGGYNPWEGLVTVPEDADVRVSAFLIPIVPETVKPVELAGTDATNALKTISATQLPTEASPLSLLGGCASVYVSSNRVLAVGTTSPACAAVPYLSVSEGSSTPTVIFSPVDTMRSVVAYPERSDALVVAVGTQIYAIALDPRTPQTFAKLISGAAPMLAEGSDGTVVIEDAGHAYSLKL